MCLWSIEREARVLMVSTSCLAGRLSVLNWVFSPLSGNQNLKYTLRTADTFRVMHTGRLPVNKGETLKWIGITDEGVGFSRILSQHSIAELTKPTPVCRHL